jgi:hypothetical protein
VGYFVFFLLSMCSHRAPTRFLSGSQKVPQDVPYSTSDLPHMVCPKLTPSISFCFVTGVQRDVSIRGVPNVPKKLMMGQ